MKLLFFFMTLFSFQSFSQVEEILVRNAEDEEEEILIFDDRKDLSKFRKVTRELISTAAISLQDLIVGGSVQLFTIENLSTGIILQNGILKPEYIHHDVDKVYSSMAKNLPQVQTAKKNILTTPLRHWSMTKVGTKIAVPANIELGSISPMSFYSRSEAGRNGYVQVTSPINEYLYKEDELVDALVSKLKRGFKAVRKVKISTKPSKLWEEYPFGTEITHSKDFVFVQRLGAEKKIGLFNADFNYFAVYQFTGVGTMKILGDPDRKLIKLTIEKKKRKGHGRQGAYEMEYGLFEVGFIKAKLNVKFVTSSREKSRASDLIHEYIYDIGYPGAEEALQEALKGKLEKTQALAVDRGGVDSYMGILIERDASGVIHDLVKRSRFGLSINENYMKVMDALNRRSKSKTNYLYDEYVKIDRDSSFEEADDYGGKKKTYNYEHMNTKYKASFWRLWGKFYQSSHISAQIENKISVIPSIGPAQSEHFKLKYNFNLEIRKSSKRLKKLFYEPISHIANLSNILMQENGDFDLSRFCSDDKLNIKLSAEITEGAIAHIIHMSDEEIYQNLALMLNLTQKNILLDKKIRHAVANKLFKKEVYKKRIKDFDRKFMKYIHLAREAPDYHEVSKIFRDLFAAYKKDIFPYEFILYLNRLKGKDPAMKSPFYDVRTAMSIKGPNCSLTWDLVDDSKILINDK